MFCENCGKELPREAVFCVNCGTPVAQGENNAAGGFSPDNKWMEPYRVMPEAGGAAPVRKKGGLGMFLKIFIPVAVLVLALAGGVVFGMGTDFFRRTFSSPEKYFQYVLGKSLQKNAAIMANNYNTLIRENMNFTDRTVGGTIEVRLGDGAKALLEMAGGVDNLDWLSQVGLETELSVKEKIFSGNAALKLGENEILSGNFAADEKGAYLQVPVLSEQYVGVDFETMMEKTPYSSSVGMREVFGYLDSVYTNLPDKEQMEKILYRYFCLAISCIDEVEREKGTLSAGGVDEKCTSLETVIRAETAQNMVKTVLKEMREDEELKEIIKKLSKIEGFDGVYDEYRDAIDMALDEVDNIELSENLVLTVYVDNKGNIIGFQEKAGDFKVFGANTKKGKDVGYKVVFDTDGVSCLLEGQGIETDGKVSADFVLEWESYGELQSVEFRCEDFDRKAAEEGNIKGTVIVPMKEVDELFALNNRILRRYDMALYVDAEGGNVDAELRLMEETEEIAAVSCSFRQEAGKEGSIPSKNDVVMVENEMDLLKWAGGIESDDFIKGLKKTEIPKDIISVIEDEMENALAGIKLVTGMAAPY